MKTKFFEYYQPSKAEFDKIWAECHFSFDASVLLDLYRFSAAGREELLGAIKTVRDRVWITHQAAYEFNKRRLEIMASAHVRADKIVQRLIDVADLIESENGQHPYLDSFTLDPISEQLREAADAVQTMKSQYPTDDSLGSELLELLDGRVGDPYPSDRLSEQHLEIDKRYSEKVPPGYMDVKEKSKPGSDGDPYGDCILWFQLIDHARESKVPVVFITRDRKEDWWTRIHGRTIQPRHELRREFRDKAGQDFYLYETPQFIQLLKLSADLFKEAETLSTVANTANEDSSSSDESASTADIVSLPAIDWLSLLQKLLVNRQPVTSTDDRARSILGRISEAHDTESVERASPPPRASAEKSTNEVDSDSAHLDSDDASGS